MAFGTPLMLENVETEIDPAWLPPPRANTLIPDFVPDAPVAPLDGRPDALAARRT